MRRSVAVLVLAVALVLTACSSIHSGYVTRKEYHPAYTTSTTTNTCYSRDSKGICTFSMPSTTVNHFPERYTLSLQLDDKTGWVDVSPGEYESYEIGDYYNGGSE